jgi:hypothetical protein
MLAGVQHGVVFDSRGDDMISFRHDPKNRQIIGFRSPARENDF